MGGGLRRLNDGAFGEPEFKFSFGVFGAGGGVDEVVLNGEGHVAADGAGFGFHGVGGSHHGADGSDRVGAGDGHGDDRAAGEIVDDVFEEGAFAVLVVVGFDGFARGVHQFHSGDFEAAEFDTARDFADEVALDAARLDEDEGGFHDSGRLPGGVRVRLGPDWLHESRCCGYVQPREVV